MKVWRREGWGLSEHFLVEALLKLVGGWRSAGRVEGVRNVIFAREANINVVGNWRMPVLGDLNERAISLE